jgi:8-oxo-dGTP diphosphatase
MPVTYKQPRPALTVDCAVFGLDDGDLKVLLVQRDIDPFTGSWSLPGGFVRIDETLDDAARRELAEETGATNIFLEQLYTFSEVDRDPSDRVVTVGYYSLVKLSDHRIRSATDSKRAAWFAVGDVPSLAFDHGKILKTAHHRLRAKVRYQPIGFELLPQKFTLTQLQKLYEVILDRQLDKRNFRKKLLAMGVLLELNEIEQDVAHRAARLYSFDKAKYDRMTKKGFNFEL